MSLNPLFRGFHTHHKDTRGYLEWTKALDDYGVIWTDATVMGATVICLEVGRQGDQLYLLEPHQSLDDPESLDNLKIGAGLFAYAGDTHGNFGRLSEDKALSEARLVWCQTCHESSLWSAQNQMCPTCGGHVWMTERGHLTWFVYPGIVKFHPLWRSWYEGSAASSEGILSRLRALGGEAGKNDLFDEAVARQAGEREAGQWERLKNSLSGRARVHGWPEVKRVEELARLYPNFSEVCDFVLAEIRLAPHRKAKMMSIPNLLILGGPSCGKSSFCRRLAQILAGDDWERIDFAQNPSAFELTGTDSGYNRAKEGRVLRLLASKEGTPVLNPVLILDELDKVDEEMRYSPLPALLSLLDKNDAAKFRDAFLGFPADASGIQFLATTNDRYRIKGPLASRFEMFSVADYSPGQFIDIVLPTMFAEWCVQFHEGTFPPALSRKTREYIGEQAGYVPRRVHAILVNLANQRFREFAPAPTFESLEYGKQGP